jgi:hypothetical protein
MSENKFMNGAFVFVRASGLEPRSPDELLPIACAHGIDARVIPEYVGDRATFSRAITNTSKGLTREGFLLRPIRRTSSEVVYGIVKEEKNEAIRRVDHEFEATVSWNAEPDPSLVVGEHVVAQRVNSAFQQLRGKIIADDWSGSITTYLERHDAARVRGDGRVYWVPPQRLNDIKRIGAFLQDIGIDLVLCEIEPEIQTVVQDVAKVSIEEELDRLQEEADGFDGRQKPSTYTRRLEEYQRLRQRAVLYRDALGVGSERAQKVLDELEQRVSSMLTLRKQTVVHRDGTSITNEEEPKGGLEQAPALGTSSTTGCCEETQPLNNDNINPSAIGFLGAKFTLRSDTDGVLTYISDDAAAKSSVAALESMGLAGKWQNVGPAKISVQNSGPEGAAVSLHFQLPKELSLFDASSSLSAWGIQVNKQ